MGGICSTRWMREIVTYSYNESLGGKPELLSFKTGLKGGTDSYWQDLLGTTRIELPSHGVM